MLRNLTIGSRLLMTLVFLCIALVLAGGAGFYGTMVNHKVTEASANDQTEIILIGRINVKVFDSRLHIAQARLNTEESNLLKEAKILADNNKETLRDLEELKKVSAGTESREVAQAFIDTVSAFVVNYLQPVEQALQAADAEKMNALVASLSSKYYNPIKQTRSDLMKAIETNAAQKRAEADAIYETTLTLTSVSVAGGILLALLFGGMVMRTISQDTNALLDSMLHIEKDRDLRQRIEVKGQDEIARIAQAVNGVLDAVHDFARSVQAQSQQNISATANLLTKTSSVSDGAQQQSEAARQASERLAAIVSNIHEISRRTNETQRLTLSGTQLGEQGSEVVHGTANEMAKIAQQVQVAADDIRNLDKQSCEIDTIVSAISDIADQTNLLALNAAIESARAGESGRGFAVVADEVRKLAERTRHFTDEIQKTISSIRSETAAAVSCMETGRELAENGVSTATAAANMISEIRAALDAINLAVTDITKTLGSQESSVDMVAGQIDQIARLSQENALNAGLSWELASSSENGSKTLAKAASAFKV